MNIPTVTLLFFDAVILGYVLLQIAGNCLRALVWVRLHTASLLIISS
jgi:hypothetical protein